MNERIKELYSKVVAESENMRWNIEDAEKFAELLVRECVELFDGNEQSELGYRIGDRIYKHFGVK